MMSSLIMLLSRAIWTGDGQCGDQRTDDADRDGDGVTDRERG